MTNGAAPPAEVVHQDPPPQRMDDVGQLTKALRAGIRLHHALTTTGEAAGRRSAGLRALLDRVGAGLSGLRGLNRPHPGPNELLVTTPYGRLIIPAEDHTLVTYVSDGGVLEPGTTSVVERLLREGDTFVDVGAHIGLLTIPAALCVGPRGTVIAIEPVPRLADVLRRNVALNGVARRVRVEQCAAGEAFGSAHLHVAGILGHSSLVPLEDATRIIEVPVRPLDAIVPAGRRVALVKIDVEGHETAVWRGMRRIIAENPSLAVIVEYGPSHLARAQIEIAAWLDTFRTADFEIYEIDERTGVCRPLRSQGLESVVSMNLLLVRGECPGFLGMPPL